VLYHPWREVSDPAQVYGAASGVRGTQRIVRCVDCGMIYESPRFDEGVILEAYARSADDGHDSQYRLRVRSFLGALRSLRGHLPPARARVLDVGTAGGAFLDAAARFGYRAEGLEPSRFLVEQARARGLIATVGTIESFQREPESFDLITLWDVLEHLTDPKGALKRIRPWLRRDGVLLINLPDIGTWQARLAGRRFWWILSVHPHHFTRATLAKMCLLAGFEVFHAQRYWQILELGYLQEMAVLYGVPLASSLRRLTPGVLRSLSVPYYASQATVLARPAP
jgi:2-polyprenyl-3-methyl-5-hydroxy-6-metoxy-1,4-benzoquinol methylase